MRKILIMHGIQGSEKSTWISENNLEQYTISTDKLRLLFNSPVMDSNGQYSISQAQNRRVFEFMDQLLNERMDRGEFIVIDSMNRKTSDFARFQQLAKLYFYDILVVDFSDVALETCLMRNKNRKSYQFVQEDIVRKCYDDIKKSHIPKNLKSIKYHDVKGLKNWLHIPIINLDLYKKVITIGDIQGCFTPIAEFFQEPLSDDTFYIFTGDFIDRGPENGEVMKWAVENLTNKKNVCMIMGNHELHLRRWVSNQPCVSNEFELNTLPQMIEVGITKEQVYPLVREMKDIFMFIYNGQQVVVTHAGICKMGEGFEFITSKNLWNGTGGYTEGVDEIFADNHQEMLQIHGHRNKHSLPAMASDNSLNLESRIEFGGNLRIVELEKIGV